METFTNTELEERGGVVSCPKATRSIVSHVKNESLAKVPAS